MPEPAADQQATCNRISEVALQQRGELLVLAVGNRHAEAAIALQGAQVLEFTPRGERPVVWLSDAAGYRRGESVRGGIPICWPWFGALARNPDSVRAMVRGADLPAHGLVRDRDWTLLAIDEQDDGTTVTLGFITDHPLQTQWPHAAALELTVRVGRTLQLRLTTRNLGAGEIAVSQALHTYLAVSDIDQVAVTGFEERRYIDTLNDWCEQLQQGAIRFTGETDRIYLDVPPTVQLQDSGWERSITLRAENSASAVVWNPWVEKAARLSQFGTEAWRAMACIETANVLGDVITLAPGASATLGVEIGLSG